MIALTHRLLSRFGKFLFKKLLVIWVICFWIGGFFPVQGKGQDTNYKAQSLFIYKFTKYVNWPEGAIDDEVIIGVYGNSPILDELELMSSLKKAGVGKPIKVKQITSDEEMRSVHILYIASSKSRELKSIVAEMEDSPVLLVAERGGLAKKGACINFIVLDNDTLRFEVNQANLSQRQLAISEELLSLGFVVK